MQAFSGFRDEMKNFETICAFIDPADMCYSRLGSLPKIREKLHSGTGK